MLFSVIIPCYNVADCIVKCINSVLDQSCDSYEIILVNDGSTDNLETILAENGFLNNAQIQYFHQSNQGANAARNFGLTKANGTYIQFLDADDYLETNKFKIILDEIASQNAPDIILSGYKTFNAKGQIVKEFLPNVNENTWVDLMNSNLGITSAIIWKKEVVLNAGGWDVSLKSSQEYNLLFRILKLNTKFQYIKKILTNIVNRSGSISNTNQGENWLRFVKLRLEILNYLELNKEIITVDINQIRNSFFSSLRNLYPYNPSEAVELYNQQLRGKFTLTQAANMSKSYILMYKIFGFPLADKIKTMK